MKKEYYQPPFAEVSVKVWGTLACFTRPELKVERVSYPVMTPSAARGMLEAILFKPEFSYAITRIEILRPVRFVSIRRNEVQVKVSMNEVLRWYNREAPLTPILADVRGRIEKTEEEDHEDGSHAPITDEADSDTDALQLKGQIGTQRNMLALADVAYNVFACIVLRADKAKWRSRFGGLRPIDNIRKYQAAFMRRVVKGQCYHRPALGCRELCAEFAPVREAVRDDFGTEIPNEPLSDFGALGVGEPLGRMLYDIVYSAEQAPRALHAEVFDARVQRGVMITDRELLQRQNRLYSIPLET